MKNSAKVLTILIVTLATACGSSHVTPAPATDLSWLSGCWAGADGAKEVWSQPEGTMLFGYGTTYKGKEISFYEQLRIETVGDETAYFAIPAGQSQTKFTMRDFGENQISFINEKHDYPQVISYRRTGNKLTAVISLIDGSNSNSFVKVTCR